MTKTKTTNFYYVFVLTKDGKHFAFANKVHGSLNLYSVITSYKYLDTVHQCKTYTEAQDIAEFWNQCYKNNGTYQIVY